MFILIFLFCVSNLCASEVSVQQTKTASSKRVLTAKKKLEKAKRNKRSEEEIKMREAAVKKAEVQHRLSDLNSDEEIKKYKHAAEIAQADYRVNLARKKVMDVHYALVSAQLDKRSEEEIKKHEAAVKNAATDMLFGLATHLNEAHIKVEDVDFCLAHNPDVNAIRDYESPLFCAIRYGHITLVRMLIAASANVHFTTETFFWGDDTTLVHVAEDAENYPALAILLEAGAPLPFDYAYDGYNPAFDWGNLNEKGVLTKHRQSLIDTINGTNLLVPNLSPIIVDYAFGRPPKINPETRDEYYSDDEGGEGEDEDKS